LIDNYICELLGEVYKGLTHGCELITMGRKLRCEICGGTFNCGIEAEECWCANIQLSASALDALRRMATDCVCPQCLSEFASET
jgi:hypothetical protein